MGQARAGVSDLLDCPKFVIQQTWGSDSGRVSITALGELLSDDRRSSLMPLSFDSEYLHTRYIQVQMGVLRLHAKQATCGFRHMCTAQQYRYESPVAEKKRRVFIFEAGEGGPIVHRFEL